MSQTVSISAETTLGFLGAGQLARMSAAVAFRMGLQVAVYSGVDREHDNPVNIPNSVPDKPLGLQPLELMTPLRYTGAFDHPESLIHFAKQCTIVTLENEFLDGTILREVEDRSGTPILPSPACFQRIESKWLEKEAFRKSGLPVTPFRQIRTPEDIDKFALEFRHPFVLKSSKGGYDGYGNLMIKTNKNHKTAFEQLGGHQGHELIAEAFIPFEKELAVQVARNHHGTVVYPCCETIQENHICKTVIAPAPVSAEIREQACQLAIAAVEAIDGTGLFAFEFFLTRDGKLLLNESAPRPHNSGHYTIEGCVTSQFENHIRAIMGLPPGSTTMRKPCSVMVNLLGRRNGQARAEGTEKIWREPDAHLHIYGKETSRIGRKMGHLTVLGNTFKETLERAEYLASIVSI
ncbi:MAG: 5-(carboxyamino)imidazole ribonucleotide synthase [Balneolales bacterium]